MKRMVAIVLKYLLLFYDFIEEMHFTSNEIRFA